MNFEGIGILFRGFVIFPKPLRVGSALAENVAARQSGTKKPNRAGPMSLNYRRAMILVGDIIGVLCTMRTSPILYIRTSLSIGPGLRELLRIRLPRNLVDKAACSHSNGMCQKRSI
jgi:hypothetical protein